MALSPSIIVTVLNPGMTLKSRIVTHAQNEHQIVKPRASLTCVGKEECQNASRFKIEVDDSPVIG
jgi:hypothetical protein